MSYHIEHYMKKLMIHGSVSHLTKTINVLFPFSVEGCYFICSQKLHDHPNINVNKKIQIYSVTLKQTSY